jgi:hypothetical protein
MPIPATICTLPDQIHLIDAFRDARWHRSVDDASQTADGPNPNYRSYVCLQPVEMK